MKDINDIEFVKQTIGHCSLNSTSSYVSQMTDQERGKCEVSANMPSGAYLGYSPKFFDLCVCTCTPSI